jgi:hypothetical protein
MSLIFDVLLSGDPLRPLGVPGWSARMQRITGELRPLSDRTGRRQATLRAFRHDLAHEVAAAGRRLGIDERDRERWLTQLDDDQVAVMPSLALYRELLHEKLLDPATVWQQNDLTDMMYLSCGAGYADHVVGERRLIGDLRRALVRLGRPMNVYRKLAHLVDALGAREYESEWASGRAVPSGAGPEGLSSGLHRDAPPPPRRRRARDS